jgi:hypothetical protein
MKNLYHSNSKIERAKRLLEAYRTSNSRTTVSGRRVRWDEPGEEDDNPDVQRHNAFIAKGIQRKQDAKDRLKQKGKVPTKQGKPIFEKAEPLNEELNRFLLEFRGLYNTNRTMRFRDWIKVCSKLLDDLD